MNKQLIDTSPGEPVACKPTIRSPEDEISELIGCLTDPIIAWPSGWMDSIPERVKEQIPIQRMIMNMQYAKGMIPRRTGTDAEVVAYMFPRTMDAPMDRDWTDIYMYAANQCVKSMGTEIPDDIKVDSLPKYLEQKLDHLKRWIYEKRVDARLDRERGERRDKREAEPAELKAAQPALFDFE